MPHVYTLEENYENIADAIRAKNGSSATYTPSEMPTAISAISGGVAFPNNACLGSSTFTSLPAAFEFETRTSCANLFRLCSSMTAAPSASQLDTSSVTAANSMFEYCSALTAVPQYNTSNITNASYMFGNCTRLATVPELSFAKATSLNGIFQNCTALSNTSLQNILKSLLTATVYNGTKTLKAIGLSSAQATTCAGFAEWATLTSRGWSSGY